ncbi:hypothetical protein [Halorubellus sp. PRR65]|uniref:hypothetical protein n=1 Tax=Halorubellus sp. PRR65 TaxID=3098148 RepID=UPI002B256C3B|nr:hypothetical protein [Halorubellus sp. PRR65]
MDEALEVVELVADSGLEEAFAWVLRIIGILCLLAGLGLWLGAGMNLLWTPALLIAVGAFMLVAPQVLLFLAELTG